MHALARAAHWGLLRGSPASLGVLLVGFAALSFAAPGAEAFAQGLIVVGALAALVSLVPLALHAVRGLRAAPSMRAALARVDGVLGLRCQLSGALALVEEGRAEGLCGLAIERAEARATGIDLGRVLPPPRLDPVVAPLLLAVAALGLSLSSLELTQGPSQIPPERVDEARSLDATRARSAAQQLRKTTEALRVGSASLSAGRADRARELLATLDSAAAKLEREARRSGTSVAVARGFLAQAAGRLEVPGAGREGLREAGAALAASAAGRGLGGALASEDPDACQAAGDALAAQLAGGSEQRELSEAAQGASRLLDHPGQAPLREALERLVEAARSGDREQSARAAREVGAAARQQSEAARLEELAARASRAVQQAWQTAGGEDEARRGGAGRAGEQPPGEQPSAPAPGGQGDSGDAAADLSAGDAPGAPAGRAESDPGEGGAASPSSEPGGGQEARRGGGRLGGSVPSGAPARGPSGSVPVAGTGADEGAGAPRAEGQAAAEGSTVSLSGRVGQRGESVLLAVQEVSRGAPGERARGIVAQYGEVEEAALQGSAVPADRRELVRRYLEAIRDPR